jgi:hypothetical protein
MWMGVERFGLPVSAGGSEVKRSRSVRPSLLPVEGCSTKEFQLPQAAQRPKNWRLWAPQAWQMKMEGGRAKRFL